MGVSLTFWWMAVPIQVPWYRGSAWSYMRGGLSTRDHDYGIFNNIHHNIGTHVVHHLFPQVLIEARPKYGHMEYIYACACAVSDETCRLRLCVESRRRRELAQHFYF